MVSAIIEEGKYTLGGGVEQGAPAEHMGDQRESVEEELAEF